MQTENISNQCQILGVQGIIIQLILAMMSFSVLILKRFKESPKRSWKIWSLDTSKQGISQLLAHCINVSISLQLSQKLLHDPCGWYFSINILDNTLGVIISITILKIIQYKLLSSTSLSKYQSGNHYQKLQYIQEQQELESHFEIRKQIHKNQINQKKHQYIINYFAWFIQLLIWNFVVVVSKIILFTFEITFNITINQIAEFLLSFCQNYVIFKLIFVIVIVPLIMNCLSFWVQDSYLKKADDKVIIIDKIKPSVKDHLI